MPSKLITRQFVVDELNATTSLGVTISEITEHMVLAASQEVIERSDYDWVQLANYTLKLDGNDETWIYLPVKPIITLDTIVIYNSDKSEYENIDSDDMSDKIIIDYNEAYLKTIESASWTMAAGKFITGTQNVYVTGHFGVDGSLHSLIKHIALLVVCRNLQTQNPQRFKFDIIKERIGKYEYQSSTSGVAKDNEKLSLDGQITMMLKSLRDRNLFGFEVP